MKTFRCLAAMALGGWAAAAALPVDRTDLFAAGAGGYTAYRVPGMVVTARGTILVYCEARQEGKSDWEDIDLLLRRSADGGRTWEAPRRIGRIPGPHRKNPVALAFHAATPNQVTYSNPVMIAERGGGVDLMFCLEFQRCFVARSDDDGVSFSAPREITSSFEPFRAVYPWRIIAVGPGHGIELKNGREVVPVWMSTGAKGGGFHPSVVGVVTSDDRGRTWQAGDIALPSGPNSINPTCAEAVELSDGRVMLNARNESPRGRRLVSVSPDGATGWSPPTFDEALTEPGAMGGIVRSGSGIWFSHPDNSEHVRKNLTLKLSRDDGRTWPVSKTLEPGMSAYSDLGVSPDGTILCFYERGLVAGIGHRPQFLTLARIPADWLSSPGGP